MKRIITALTAIMLTASVFAQTPEKMSYHAVIRNSSDRLVTNQAIRIKISILLGSATGAVVYSETQTPSTSENGLVTIEIGEGADFVNIDWANGPYFIKTETDPTGGINYTISGTSQLLSVPYAMYAKKAGNVFSGNYDDLLNKPSLFDGTWASLMNKPTFAVVATSGTFATLLSKPTTLGGYGITDALSISHPANNITNVRINNWNTAYTWGNHATSGYQSFIAAGTTNQYWRGDKTWRILDNSAVGLGNVENTKLSTWTGSSNVTTLGIITEGVWNAGLIISDDAIIGNTIVKTGGTASQFLKADGSVDANTYITTIREIADEFTAANSQSSFTLTQTPTANNTIKMFINGVRTSNSAYSTTGNVLTYIPANNDSYVIVVGDRVQFDYYY